MPAQDRVQAHPDSYLAELRADVRAGLTAEPKSLPPKYFYDERGSELFEEITRLPEYYPTRAETAILRARAGEIAELSRCESLVELGSGTSAKTGLLLRAYNDRAGVTAEFNRNVLKVINRELRADFNVEEFEHVASWDAEREWIEMRLRSVGAQVVTVGDLGLTVSFDAGEEMRTEVSAKFRPAGIRAELAGAGFRTLRFWTDLDGDFGLTLAELAGPQDGRFRRGPPRLGDSRRAPFRTPPP